MKQPFVDASIAKYQYTLTSCRLAQFDSKIQVDFSLDSNFIFHPAMPRQRPPPTKRTPYHTYTHSSYNWIQLFTSCDQGCSQRKIARDNHIPHKTFVNRYTNWIEAGRPTRDNHKPYNGLGDARGRHLRILTETEEKILLERLEERRNRKATHDSHIRKYATQLYQSRQQQQVADANTTHATRSNTSSATFTASAGWIIDFKRRYHFTTTTRPEIRPKQPKDKTKSTQLFFSHLRYFTHDIPISHIFNMDETFIAYAPGYFKVLSRRGDRTKLCTGEPSHTITWYACSMRC